MSYGTRQELYQKIEECRGRPLIAYVTTIRPGLVGHMAQDAIEHIIDQIRLIPKEQEEIDFLIISNGGDPITSLRIISLLRERFKKISAIIPYVAYSAATILSLGADEIIMHPYSNLGPVDPQLTVPKQKDNGQPSQLEFSSEDIRNYIEFVKSDVGITDQDHLTTAFNALAKEVGPLPIGSAKRSQQLSLSLSEKMLETHMDDKSKAVSISKALNSSYFHHGYAVGRTEAKEIGLNVISPDEELEELMWDVWSDYSSEMKCGRQFNIIAEIMSNPVSANQINSIPVVNLPANTPPQMAQGIIAAAAQNTGITMRKTIEIGELIAAIESVRMAVQVQTKFSIAYWRDPNMALGFNATAYSDGWKPMEGE